MDGPVLGGSLTGTNLFASMLICPLACRPQAAPTTPAAPEMESVPLTRGFLAAAGDEPAGGAVAAAHRFGIGALHPAAA